MLQTIYYVIISVLAILTLYLFTKKKSWHELVSAALVLVVFALRALHIK